MSVLKAKRKASQFEVFHQLKKMRKEVTDLLLRDFGYNLDKATRNVEKTFGGRPYEELSPDEKVRYEKLMEKNIAFAEWFIADERKVIVDADDGGRAVTVALAEVFAGLALVDGGEVVGALGPVFAGKNNLVGVHCVPSCRCGVSCVHVSCTFTI